ncbi:MAG TPA: riboflavin biosynthesis protein RibD, partial [Acidimicrobiaceae bacterium]|nr:riboflavin biosynthesis protein RibD [Acidimicrobiaceae bacterium]
MSTQFSDESLMQRAVATADGVRGTTAPNPWVGAAVLGNDGNVYDGATQAPGSAHAERVALEAAGPSAQGATLYSTLEPCCHYGRTPPCTDLIINSGIRRVV